MATPVAELEIELTYLALVLASIMGLSLGMMGGGGSILAVPIFVYVAGFEPKPSIAMTLAVVGTVALYGAFNHWRNGNVAVRTALVFGVFAMAGAYGGARLSAFVSGRTQLAIFAAVMLVAAVFMWRGRGEMTDPKQKHRRIPIFLLGTQGVGVGVLTGLVGVGGGFLIVPALVLLADVPMKRAVGTSLLVIAMNAWTGFLGYLGQVAIDWLFMLGFVAIAFVGIRIGMVFFTRVPQQALRRTFAAFLVVMGMLILFQNRGAFL